MIKMIYKGDDFVLAYVSSQIPFWNGTVGFYFVTNACIRFKDDSIFCLIAELIAAPEDQDLMRVERGNQVIKMTILVR